MKEISIDINDGSGGNNGRDIDIVFFKAWRNIVIRSEILFHTRLYNLHLGKFVRIQSNQLSRYKYKSYLDILGIELEVGNEKKVIKIPSNLSHISFGIGITSIQINCTIPKSVTSVKFDCYGIIFNKGLLHNGIKRLNINSDFNQKLSLDWLPHSLESLTLGSYFQQSIEPNQLPKSLTELKLHEYYGGYIMDGSIPLTAIKSLNYNFNQINLTKTSIPVSTLNLEFDKPFNQPIKQGDIPHNVQSIKFNFGFNNEIEYLPSSLKSLVLPNNGFDKLINANVLPSNLTSIDMGSYIYPLLPDLFPMSITSIILHNYNKLIPKGYFFNHINLKSLKFTGNLFNGDIPANSLPPSLTLLDLGANYDKPFIENSLPQSLLILKIHSINYQLKVGELSNLTSITTLELGTKFLIPVGSLPCNLKELHLRNRYFFQNIRKDGLLPLHSLQSIY